jgi:hypothetical protein
MVTQSSPSPIKAEGPRARCRISMRRDPAHPDADAIANDGEDERGEYHPPDPDLCADLHGFHTAYDRADSGLRRTTQPEANPSAGLRLAPGCAGRRSIDHRNFGLLGTAVRALINDLVSPAKSCGLDRADHHETLGFAVRAVETGRERIADLVKMT